MLDFTEDKKENLIKYLYAGYQDIDEFDMDDKFFFRNTKHSIK